MPAAKKGDQLRLCAYTVEDVAKRLGLNEHELERYKETGFVDFPFNVLKVGDTYRVSRKQVDDFLLGKRFDPRITHANYKWRKGVCHIWNIEVDDKMHMEFATICENINKRLRAEKNITYKLPEFRRLCVQEFINRHAQDLKFGYEEKPCITEAKNGEK